MFKIEKKITNPLRDRVGGGSENALTQTVSLLALVLVPWKVSDKSIFYFQQKTTLLYEI